MKSFKLTLLIAGLAVFSACQNRPEAPQSTVEATSIPAPGAKTETNVEVKTQTSVTTGLEYKKGDRVPNNEVCMVNNAYMGKLQLEVPFEGKTYHGCCDMCVNRIPNDPGVRKSLDPNSLEEVDKATAYIVLIGEAGEVAYFKNEQNYQDFINQGGAF